MIDTTLLDSTEPISMEALQAFFQANDFSTMVSRYDAERATEENNAFYLKVKKIFQDTWNKEMGALTKKNSLMNFSEFYPIRCLESREEDLVSGTVMELLAEEEQCDLLLDLVFDAMQEHLRVALESHATAHGKSVDALTEEEIAFVVNQFADQFLGHMMNLLLQVQNVPEIMEMGKEMPAKEDYAKTPYTNYDKINGMRKWDHLRTQIQMTSLDDIVDAIRKDPDSAPEDMTYRYDIPKDELDEEYKMLRKAFMRTLSPEDQKIFALKEEGMKQKEIAKKLGYANHSAVSKRIKHIQKACRAFLKERTNMAS